jgi:type 1 glutamine amidotransferase
MDQHPARGGTRAVAAAALLVIAGALASTFGLSPSPAIAKAKQPAVLVFHKAAGFTHSSIPAGIDAIKALGRKYRFEVDATADSDAFTPANLAKYDAVIFLHTTGNVLPADTQRHAFETYIKQGGGYLGIHAASDMGALRESWPWYLGLVGAAFKGHTSARSWTGDRLSQAPADADSFVVGNTAVRSMSWEPATVIVEDRKSPMMQGWGARKTRRDEWYGFLSNPRAKVHVIASLDETSYNPAAGKMGDHPIVWCHTYDGGRAVYTGLGHPVAAWQDAEFLKHIKGGIDMAIGKARFNC